MESSVKAQVVEWQDFKGTVYINRGIYIPERETLIAFDLHDELIVYENASEKVVRVRCQFNLSEDRYEMAMALSKLKKIFNRDYRGALKAEMHCE